MADTTTDTIIIQGESLDFIRESLERLGSELGAIEPTTHDRAQEIGGHLWSLARQVASVKAETAKLV